MTDLARLRNDIQALPEGKLRDLFNFIPQDIRTEFKAHCFNGGQVYIHCGSLSVVKMAS